MYLIGIASHKNLSKWYGIGDDNDNDNNDNDDNDYMEKDDGLFIILLRKPLFEYLLARILIKN